MKKAIIVLLMMFSSSVFAAEILVPDMTTDGVYTFTPGVTNMNGHCDFNWGGSKAYKVEDFFQGKTSWSADIQQIYISPGNYGKRCINMKVDVVPGSQKVGMPFVNEEAFAHFGGVRGSNVSKVVAFSTSGSVSPFTIAESTTEWNETYITAGTYGAIDFFRCQLPTDSLTLEWLFMAGIDKEIAKGYVLSITWNGSRRKCAGITMTLDPKLLVAAPVEEQPLQCKPGCVPAP